MDRKYKPIRPAAASLNSEPFSHPDRSQGPTLYRKKRQQVKVACDACRSKKSACNGQRPICAACIRRGSSCTFGGQATEVPPSPPKLERYGDAPGLIRHLLSSPNEDALKTLSDLRARADLSSILDMLQSEEDQFSLGPDQESVEFELAVRHPILYPARVTVEHGPQISAQRAGKHHSTGIYRDAQELDQLQMPADTRSGLTNDYSGPLSLNASRMGDPTPYVLCDIRLNRLTISEWTDVPISSEIAGYAISRYLELDHPILSFFDANIFLADLANHTEIVCSGFLVNSLLSWACLDARVTDLSPDGVQKAFYSAALVQYNVGHGGDSIGSLAALQLLNLTATFSGQGNVGTQLLRQAIAMGKRMNLLSNGVALTEKAPLDGIDMRVASQASWGLFCYATLHSLHCQQNELGSLSPPSLPIPSDYLSISGPSAPEVLHTGNVFSHLCELWTIVHEIIQKYYKMPQTHQKSINEDEVSFTHGILDRLFAWGHTLPLWLVRGNKVTSHGIMLHVFYHASIISLLRPMVLQFDNSPLDSNALDGHRFKEIYQSSVNQLRQIMRTYHERFANDHPSVLWHTACLFIANDAIRSQSSDQQRRYLLSCSLEGYYSFYPRYPVTLPIVKGLLTMAISSKLLTSQEGIEAIRRLRAKGNEHDQLPEPTVACFMVDLDLALTDQKGAHIDSLAQRFDEMVLFDEFTNDRIDEEGGVTIN